MIRVGFVRARLSSPPPSHLSALAYGCLMVAAPTALRAIIDPVVSGTTFVAYYPFILLAALLMAWPHAMAIAVASAIVANFLFMEPKYSFLATTSETIGTLLFVACCLLIITVGQTLRRAVHDLESARTRESHLNRELQHRVKNTLAVVQGLVVQTFRNVPDAGEALDKLQGRIRALADANEILRDGRWEECRLPELAVRALEPFNSRGAFTLCGPECSLPEVSCVPLVLALHELATNAVKYGALSTDTGAVELSWEISSDDQERDLTVRWQERAGPHVNAPQTRGLGSKLLRPQHGLDDVQLRFERDGVYCQLQLTGARALPSEQQDSSNLPPVTLYSTIAAAQAG